MGGLSDRLTSILLSEASISGRLLSNPKARVVRSECLGHIRRLTKPQLIRRALTDPLNERLGEPWEWNFSVGSDRPQRIQEAVTETERCLAISTRAKYIF